MGNTRQSAGLLLYRNAIDGRLEVLIAHPGGPIFAKKQEGHWGIPKGEFEPGERALDAAKREFEEETGLAPVAEEFIDLSSVVQKGGKRVFAWAFEGNWEAGRKLVCNMINLEWPPRSGHWHHIPEIDEVRMVDVEEARRLMKPAQFEFVERLLAFLLK